MRIWTFAPFTRQNWREYPPRLSGHRACPESVLYMRSNYICPSHQVPSAKQNLCLLPRARVLRTSEGPCSRTVCNISALPPEVRDLVAAALSDQTCVVLEQIELSQALDYGGLAVLREAWQRFGLEKLFADLPQVRQRQLLQA